MAPPKAKTAKGFIDKAKRLFKPKHFNFWTLLPRNDRQGNDYANYKREEQHIPAFLICVLQIAIILHLQVGGHSTKLANTTVVGVLAAGTVVLVLILICAQYRPLSKIIELFKFVFFATNIAVIALIFVESTSTENAPKVPEPGLPDDGTIMAVAPQGDLEKLSFHYTASLYTWYIVLHHLRTHWMVTWWFMLVSLIVAIVLVSQNFGENC